MTKPTAWMPMYWGDYLRDTGHLSTHQHGAYLLLIAHYWSTGKALPDDDARLCIICRVPPHLWRVVRTAISPFFKVENGRWHHERIERELTVAFDRSEHGKRGATARWRQKPANAGALPEHRSGNAHHTYDYESSSSENLTVAARDPALNAGSGPRAQPAETTKERLARLALEARQALLRKSQP